MKLRGLAFGLPRTASEGRFAVASFRRFLGLTPEPQQSKDPVKRLAELGRAEDPPPASRQFAELTTKSDPAPLSDVWVDKNAGVAAAADSKKESGMSSRSGYRWISQKSREAGSEAVRFADTNF